MRFSYFAFLLLAGLLTGCGGNQVEPMDNVRENTTKAENEILEGQARVNANVGLEPMPPTQEFRDAAITDWTYRNGTMNFTTTGYTFGRQTEDAESLMCANSGKGQHAHLIIDNEPYIARYEPTFDQEIADGPHHVLSFLSRSYHEAIKTDQAHRAVTADAKDGTFSNVRNITEPMLFYSRPKGTYTGEAETKNVMLDFYPVNVSLGQNGYHVKAVVNGTETFDITSWQPYYLTGLPMGANTVELTLMKGDDAVDTPLNPVTRTFTLRSAPVEDR